MAITKLGNRGRSNIEGTLFEKGLWYEELAASATLDAADCGKVLVVVSSGLTLTLPAVANLKYRIVYDGPRGGTLKIAPNAVDLFLGVDLAATDADTMDLANAQAGDEIQVEYGGATGWIITRISGSWSLTAV